MPIDWTGLVAVAGGILIVLVPIIGITARFALKPIVEAIARFREMEGSGQQMEIMQQRLELMEAQLSNMESEVHRLREVSEFQAKLQSPEESET